MSTPTTTKYDLIDVEVHQKSLTNIASEMAITLMRTSGSPVVTEAKDFSTCILDAKVEQLAFSGYVTFHISTAVLGVEAVLRHVPVEEIRPGDGFMCNDPHTSGAIHQGDVGIVMPFFHDDELVGWGYVNEHVLDIGGSAVSGFAPGAFDCYAETLAFPALRIVKNGRIESGWEQFLSTNVRMAGTVLNDIRSMIAANNAGQKRLSQLLEQIGLERFRELNAVNKELSEGAVRRLIQALPDGTYESEDWVEYDGRGVEELHEVRCRLIIDGDEMTIQFRGDPQTDSFINGARPSMTGQAWTTLLSQLTYDIPINAGIWRPVHFDLGPEGTVVNSVPPAPVSQSHMETGMRVNKLLTDVLSQACSLSDDPILRGRVAGQMAQNLSFFTAYGIDLRSGQPTVAFPVSLGAPSGGGAQTVTDGMETYAAQCMVGCDVPDTEMEESTQPGLILWRRVAADTGGAGIRRGGPGVSTAMAITHSKRMTGGAYGSCAFVPPRGAAGGYPGGAGGWELLRETNLLELLERGELPTEQSVTGRKDEMPAKTGELVLNHGDVFWVINGGGGGVGDPLFREPEMVAKDVVDGYVSEPAAREIYGVVVTEAGAADLGATEAQRAAIRQARIGGTPERAADKPEIIVALQVVDGRWHCAVCDHDLGSESGNWREAAVTSEHEVSERYGELHSRVRRRKAEPRVVMRENFCPGCGSSLAVDITLAGCDVVAASHPGVNDPFAGEEV